MMWLAAICAALAIELVRPSGSNLVRRRFGPLQTAKLSHPRWRPSVAASAAPTICAALGSGAAVLLVSGPALIVALACAGVAAVALHLLRRSRIRAAVASRRRQLTESLSFLVSELTAGAMPEQALASIAGENRVLDAPARAARSGVDVVPILRDAGATAGHEALAEVASAWQVAERSGAAMSVVLARLVDRLRDEAELAHEIESELAPARATARIMAVLPLAGLGLGAMMGSNPFRVVVTNSAAAWSFALGLAMAMVGLLWIDRLADTGSAQVVGASPAERSR